MRFVLTLILLAAVISFPATRRDTVILIGFSILGEVINNDVSPKYTGSEIITSFAGSGTITNQILMGVPAQVAIVAAPWDKQRLSHLIDNSFTLPHNGILNRSPMVFAVQKGNPKKLRDFNDLTDRNDIKIIQADPALSGGAKWALLALTSFSLSHNRDPKNDLRSLKNNTVSFASSSRAALTQLAQGFGDVLVTYEVEVDRNKFDIVYPPRTIYTVHHVVPIAREINEKNRANVEALLELLFSSQDIYRGRGFRGAEPLPNELPLPLPEYEWKEIFTSVIDPFLNE